MITEVIKYKSISGKLWDTREAAVYDNSLHKSTFVKVFVKNKIEACLIVKCGLRDNFTSTSSVAHSILGYPEQWLEMINTRIPTWRKEAEDEYNLQHGKDTL